MPRKSEQEWLIIENDYIKNPVTYEQLKVKYNISPRSLVTRFTLRNIEEKRKKYLNATSLKIEGQQIKEKITDDFNLIKQLDKLIKLKSQAEIDALIRYYELTGKSVSPKEIMHLINKSKDGLAELIKTSELLKGNATERTALNVEERQQRLTRLRGLLSAN